MKKNYNPAFEDNARLLYVCEADEQQAVYPSLLHMHNDRLELVYVYKGEGIHRIGDNLYHVQAGDLSIFNSAMLHDELASADYGMSFFNCGISDIKVPGLAENCLIGNNFNPVLHCGELSWSVENIFKQMKYYLSEGKEGAEGICQYLMKSLLCIIMKQLPLKYNKNNSEDNELIIKVKSYIDEHYFEKLTFESLCQILHISESFLSHKFKQVTGFSPIQYITRRRIGKAQTLLISSDNSITEIGALVGYENTSYFNMLFKKIIGMTPLEYRRYWVGKDQYRKLDRLNKM